MFINFSKHKLQRNIGLVMLCVIGLGGTVGGGMFVLISHGAAVAGEYLPVSFLLGGVLAFFGALLYAELGTTIPRSGASLALVFNTTRRRYYPFIFSWLVLLGDVSYLVINAIGLAFYASFFIPVPPIALALGALLLSVLINLRGAASTGKSEIITAATLIGLLAVYTGLVITRPEFQFEAGTFFTELPRNIFPLIAGVALIFTTYIGYEYIASVAEEVKEPSKNIPRALMITVGAATAIFTVVSLATVNIVPINALSHSDAPFLLVAEHLGTAGWIIIIPAAVLATAGSLLAATLVASRRLYALGEEGMFEGTFSLLNRNDVPYRAVLGVTVLAVFLLLTNSVTFVAYMGNAVYLVSLIVIALSLIRFRRQRPYLARPFKIPFFPWLPIGMMILAGGVLLLVGPVSLFATALWALLGYLVYLSTRVTVHRLYWATWGAMLFLLLFGAMGVWWLL